jgi:hypothetical protein
LVVVAQNVVVQYKIGVVIHVDVVLASVARPPKFILKQKKLLNIRFSKKKHHMAMAQYVQVKKS